MTDMANKEQTSTSDYESRPWLGSYRPGHPQDIHPKHATALAMYLDAIKESPDNIAIKYFDGTLTFGQIDRESDALAQELQKRGFEAGDRLAVYLQNVPQWIISMLAAWKLEGTAVAINPMNRQRELEYLVNDSGAKALICHPDLYRNVVADVLPNTALAIIFTTSDTAYQTRNDERLFNNVDTSIPEGTIDLAQIVADYDGSWTSTAEPDPTDVAVLTYTSGTTGVPKGAMNTHENIVFTTYVYRDWIELDGGDSILAGAPLFHITGLIGHMSLSFLLHSAEVLGYRYEPSVVRDLVAEHQPTFTLMAITAFGALMGLSDIDKSQLSSLTKVYSGGAPVAPAMRQRVEDTLGLLIHQAYGLTETTSPSHFQPLGVAAPVDEESGALSVGTPVYNTMVRIIDDAGNPLPFGEVGEIEIAGPQVVPGYWNKPEATAESIPEGRLRTGDVGFMNPDGWFFVVDRKKDMINASGYKVWPREVEDVLYKHEAINEVAVVGVPDEYRGENVKAFVSLRAGASVEPQVLIDYCKARMAAYKYPREVVILDALPKTTTGKILRRELRNQG